PAFDRSPRSAVDPRHAWMNLHQNRIFRIGIEKHPRMAWIVSTKVDTYQQQQETVEGGALWVCGV
ncbi:hypothetical protein, partial [Stenotrophomonas maltophilia]